MNKPEKILRATHGSSEEGGIKIGDLQIPCYVLEGGVRVLSGRGMQKVLKPGKSHGSNDPNFLKSLANNSFIPNELATVLSAPIKFLRPGRGGATAFGYDATLLPKICDAILQARKEEKLTPRQNILAEQAEIITRGLAHVGIIALVDEATGYQEFRDKKALQEILDKYLRFEYERVWAKRFPDEFYKEMFRLRKWNWRGMKVNRPSVVGNYTNDLIYSRLAPGVLEELRKRNPPDDRGNRKTKHHQWLTPDIGHPALSQHLYTVIAMMRGFNDWNNFHRALVRAFPISGDPIEMELSE